MLGWKQVVELVHGLFALRNATVLSGTAAHEIIQL